MNDIAQLDRIERKVDELHRKIAAVAATLGWLVALETGEPHLRVVEDDGAGEP
jgi:hypothetical protein